MWICVQRFLKVKSEYRKPNKFLDKIPYETKYLVYKKLTNSFELFKKQYQQQQQQQHVIFFWHSLNGGYKQQQQQQEQREQQHQTFSGYKLENI